MKKQIHILEGIMILLIIFISSTLVISFIYNINHEKKDSSYMWNINLDNINIYEGSNKGTINLIDDTLNLDVIFNKEQEFFTFSFDINNNGSLDAYLDEFKLDIDNPKNILKYNISYEPKKEIKVGDILKSNETNKVVVNISYPKQNKKIYEPLKLNLKLKIKYIAK